MKDTSSRNTWYLLVLALGAICGPLLYRGVAEVVAAGELWPIGLLVLGVWLGLHRTVRLGKGDYHSVYTLDDAPTFAIIFLYSTPVATLAVTSVRFLYESVRLAKGLYRHRDRVTAANVVYHFSDIVFVGFATMLAGTCLDLMGRPSPLTGAEGAAAALLSGSVWFLALFLLNALHISVAQGEPEMWLSRGFKAIRGNLANVALFLPIGVLVSVFVDKQAWLVPLLFVPVVLIHAVMEASEKLEQETQATILALSTYLEERDGYTSGHSNRVAGYAAAMARQIGLSPGEVETAHRAGIIHDLGKIDVPDAILRKPGFLTEEERAVMRTHTDRAVALGQKLVALKDGLPFGIAAYHHENYDGTGHFGLVGENIPLVSRMLAVADTWDAMTSDRPYRKGMDDSEALLRLKKAAGSQLDPKMVTAFLETYDKGEVDVVRTKFPALGPVAAA
jgi:hypothetical protein